MQAGIHWYPGHIAKYERQLTGLLKMVDIVLEVLDSRLPLASSNPRLAEKIRHKPTLIILNKSDISDPQQSARWQTLLTSGTQRAMLYDARHSQGKARIIQEVLTLGEPIFQKLEGKGRLRRPLRVLVAGMPNVGKSTLINSIVGRKKVQTGHRAGVTTSTRWIRIHPTIELMDSPGIIPPTMDDQEAAALLATVNSIGEAAFDDEETARFLIERLEQLYPGLLTRYFKVPPALWQGDVLKLEHLAEVRNARLPGGILDTLRAAQALLSDFRHSRLGRITLEIAPRPEKISEPISEKVDAVISSKVSEKEVLKAIDADSSINRNTSELEKSSEISEIEIFERELGSAQKETSDEASREVLNS
jgi:ribosome biogenesis GTPase A